MTTNELINKNIQFHLPAFDRIAKAYTRFNLIYLTLGIIEATLFVVFFSAWVQSSLLAVSLALIFLTVFSFFVLRMYLQTQKAEQFRELQENFLKSCNFDTATPEHHLVQAKACIKFATQLSGREYKYFNLPLLGPIVEKWSYWLHWQDVLSMRELMFLKAAEEHIKLVKMEPINLEVHVALANIYVMLTALYLEFLRADKKWTFYEQYYSVLEQKHRKMAEKAIEEFKILSDYAPDDPWVHQQLAYSYHDLGMPQEEIKEYETILELCPNDYDTLLKLGTLYFQQGHNSKGLKIYDLLQHRDRQKA